MRRTKICTQFLPPMSTANLEIINVFYQVRYSNPSARLEINRVPREKLRRNQRVRRRRNSLPQRDRTRQTFDVFENQKKYIQEVTESRLDTQQNSRWAGRRESQHWSKRSSKGGIGCDIEDGSESTRSLRGYKTL